jgi:hypothetical protein
VVVRLVPWLLLVACSGPRPPAPVPDEACDDPAIVCAYPGERDDCGTLAGTAHFPDMHQDLLEPVRGVVLVEDVLSVFRNHDYPDLEPFSCLQVVGGELSVRLDEGAMTSLDGLENLTYTGGLVLESNFGLRRIDALTNLRTIDGAVRVRGNALLDLGEVERWLEGVDVRGRISLE